MLNTSEETCRFEPSSPRVAAVSLNNTLPLTEQFVIRYTMDHLGQRPFLWLHAQEVLQSVMFNVYDDEERRYIKTVQRLQRNSVLRDVFIVASHVLYNIKVDDNDSLRPKARIAFHGNEDSEKQNLTSDFCMCVPTGISVITVTATIQEWRVLRIGAQVAFLHSGPADRKVFFRPPKESKLQND